MIVILGSIFIWLGSVAIAALVVVFYPEDYFIKKRRELIKKSPLRLILFSAKNILGTILIIAGILMMVLPGPGLMMILIGIILTDYIPGKRWLELKSARMPKVMATLNNLRGKMGRPPFRVPDESENSE
jgi:hypothetical protein